MVDCLAGNLQELYVLKVKIVIFGTYSNRMQILGWYEKTIGSS